MATSPALITTIDKAIEAHRNGPSGKPSLYEYIAQAAYDLGAKHEQETILSLAPFCSSPAQVCDRIRARRAK